MGQKQNKRMRKIAEKMTRNQAFYLAQNQLLEIMNSPFKVRWKFAMKILFPPKNRMTSAMKNSDIVAAAHGFESAEQAIKAGAENGK